MRLFSLLFILTVLVVSAHDLYLLPERFVVAPKGQIQVAFHNGDSFPASEVAPRVARLQDAQLSSQGATAKVQGLRTDGTRTVGNVAVPGSGTLLLSVRTVPNFIELAPAKFVAYLKEEGLAEVIAWREQHGEGQKAGRERYSKFAKSMLLAGAPDDHYRKALGFPIEIVPERNPYEIHAGQELPVQVLFRGKPAANLQVESAWAGSGPAKTTVVGRTDKNGRISVPLAAVGKWRLHALLMERCAEPAVADWESFWASLTFEIR